MIDSDKQAFVSEPPNIDLLVDTERFLVSMDTYNVFEQQQGLTTTHSSDGSVAQKMTNAATTAKADTVVNTQKVSGFGQVIAAMYVAMLKKEMREFHKPLTAPREHSGIASCASCRTHKSNSHKPAREATTVDINTIAFTYGKPTSRKTKLLAARTTKQV